MDLDFAESRIAPVLYPNLTFDRKLGRMQQIGITPHHAAMEWRQTILGIVRDSLVQIDAGTAEANDIWRLEARRRALNFAELGLSEFTAADTWRRHGNRAGWDIAAVATLGGAYRLLAKCNGRKPVQCGHIFERFLHNLTLAYAPVCGRVAVDLRFCAIVMAPARSRAFILCAGLLVQRMLYQSASSRMSRKLDIVLDTERAARYRLVMRLTGYRMDLLNSAEFALASRLAGVFQAELLCKEPGVGSIEIQLSFPAAP